MSNRVLKKLQGVNEIEKLDAQSETEDEAPNVAASDARKSKEAAANRFELLTGLSAEQSLSDTAKEDDDRENEPPPARAAAAEAPQESVLLADELPRSKLEKQDSTQSTDSLKRRKKKKKKKKQLNSQHSHEDKLNHSEDEVAASVREVNRILGEPENLPHVAGITTTVCGPSRAEKSLLSVDQRNLNPENELRRIFGSRVVQAEQAKRRGRGHFYGRTAVLVPSRNWYHGVKPGINMELLETEGDVHFFTFEHTKSYQAIQFQFLDAVETFNPDNIVALLNQHPYHVDSLIQFSDVCKMSEDLQMAAELIERALYFMETCFHSLFNVTQGNCRLDYRRSENRSFFLALFKHLNFVGQRGCSRTALEFCKVLLGLDPDTDPLCVTLLLDYYAIRAEQYQYLVRLYREWDAERNLCQLPNFAFSVPLALFHMAQAGASEDTVSSAELEADKMLQESLIMFPGVLKPLLDKCGVQPDSEVAKHTFFSATAQAQQPAALNQLQSLFVGRNYVLWKEPEVLAWLERNVRAVLKRVDQGDPLVASSAEKRAKRYQGAPRNLSRHIILSNIQEASVTLPQELSNSPIFGFDPLPPIDDVSYTRPPRTQQIGDQSMMGAFFRSLLPSFNLPQEMAGIDVRNPMALVEPEAAEHGAAGAAGAVRANGDEGDLHRSVTSLLEAMRDLLSHINLSSDVDSDDEHED
ncbi:nuclear localized protein 1 isoform X2 [Rhipicephalus microplus]|uniref:nuclear localized protein 1 isoform X2 n=1 Tax=Rhipicephalus microplus TaxID=6941 RepID=UPI0018895BFA|nr:transcription factor 25-like isoform X2 [Rhipicephalus microplus]